MYNLAHKDINKKEWHKKEGLLFQFILNEYINCRKLTENLATSTEKLVKSPRSKKTYENIFEDVENLVGSMHDFMRLFSWSHNEGALKKLVNYSILFSKQKKKRTGNEAEMQKHADQALVFGLDLHDRLTELNESKEKVSDKTAQDILKKAEKICRELKKYGKCMAPLISDFSDDENVLFFLLRHKNHLDQIIKVGFVKRQIKKDFSGDLSTFETFIVNQYKKRGFDHLIPMIKMMIHNL